MSKKPKGAKRSTDIDAAPAVKPPSPPPPSGPPPVPGHETETDKRQNRRITWALAGSVFAVTFNIASTGLNLWSASSSARSAREAAEANKLAQLAQDRAAGKVQAKFEFVGDSTNDPDVIKTFTRKMDGADEQVLRIENVDELVRWGPQVRIKNTGTEPIDAIRVEVNYDYGAAYGVGVQQLHPAPIVLIEPSEYKADEFGKLMPGQVARILLNQLVLKQISGMNWTDFPDKDRVGLFSVSVFCRLVGSQSFDQVATGRPRRLLFHWRPAGFKKNAKHVKEVMEIKPPVRIEPAGR